jgi:hypothetical protein
MVEAYLCAALFARELHTNRPFLWFVNMSNKFALSDTKWYAEKPFNFIARFGGK